jgi:hypothetical protein
MYGNSKAREQVVLEARQLFTSRKLWHGLRWNGKNNHNGNNPIPMKTFDYCAVTEVGMVAPLAPFPVYMCY